jgi:hypothetical protein
LWSMTGIWDLLLAGIAALAGVLLILKELRKRWIKRIVDHLDQGLRRTVSRFGGQYREFVLSSLRFIDVKGLATIGFYTPELDEVFVDVSLAHRAPHQVAQGVLAQLPKSVTDRRSIWDFLDRPQSMVLAVVGVPGSGKTTLLRHTAREIYRRRRSQRRKVPILLYLRDHVAAIVTNPGITAPELVRASLGRYRQSEPPGWFEQRLRDGDCVVLLDGLDEVAKQKDRRAVADWVERQTKQYPKNDFVITSRPQGYRTASVDGAVVLQVRSFTHDQVVRLVRGWYLAVEKHSTHATGEDVRLRAESAADNLLERLNGAPGLYDLTVNPLLLTMIANVHRYRGALPGSRANLYGEICQVMLWRRHEAKNLPVGLNGDKKEVLLRGLAFTMMQQRVRDLPQDQVLAEIAPALRRMSRAMTAEDFLDDVGSNGMIIERESGLYSFAHLTFQEYLAAAHIRDKGLVDVLAGFVDDIWWRETIMLYTAHSDADPIIRACLESGSPAAFSLAFECTEQGAELDPALHDRLDDLFHSIQDDLEQHRQMTRVLLARALRPLVRAGAGSRVCAVPITMGIYKWYTQSTQGHVPDGREVGAENPVIGVRGSDAIAFTRWVNTITSGDPGYRLPSEQEINDPAVRQVIPTPTPSIWVAGSSDSEYPELWTPAHVNHPHVIDSATLSVHVREDFYRSEPALVRILLLLSTVAACKLARDHQDAQIDLDRISLLTDVLKRLFKPAIDVNLDDALDRSFYHALASEYGHNTGLELALDVANALATSELKEGATYDADKNLERLLDHCLEVAWALHRIRDTSLDQREDTCLDRVLGRARFSDLALQLGRPVARDIGSADPLTAAAGIAISSTLHFIIDKGSSSADWIAEFSRIYIDETRADGMEWRVSLDELESDVRYCCASLRELILPERVNPNSWNYRAVNRLEEIALPVVARQQLPVDESASTIRLMALCLAAEADAFQARALGDRFRKVAAGITLLERRANGQAPITETIILAAD